MQSISKIQRKEKFNFLKSSENFKTQKNNLKILMKVTI